jgi:CHAT domain-containing protein
VLQAANQVGIRIFPCQDLNLFRGFVAKSLTRAEDRQFRESAGGTGVIHIASHAETETNHPLESFLLFAPNKRTSAKETDSALTARDLLGMRLRANLVMLSACETARGKIGEGDGVMGLGGSRRGRARIGAEPVESGFGSDE